MLAPEEEEVAAAEVVEAVAAAVAPEWDVSAAAIVSPAAVDQGTYTFLK